MPSKHGVGVSRRNRGGNKHGTVLQHDPSIVSPYQASHPSAQAAPPLQQGEEKKDKGTSKDVSLIRQQVLEKRDQLREEEKNLESCLTRVHKEKREVEATYADRRQCCERVEKGLRDRLDKIRKAVKKTNEMLPSMESMMSNNLSDPGNFEKRCASIKLPMREKLDFKIPWNPHLTDFLQQRLSAAHIAGSDLAVQSQPLDGNPMASYRGHSSASPLGHGSSASFSTDVNNPPRFTLPSLTSSHTHIAPPSGNTTVEKRSISYSDDEFERAMQAIVPGSLINDRYRILSKPVAGKCYIHRAEDNLNDGLVVLKFFQDQEKFNNAKNLHMLTKRSDFVCKIVDELQGDDFFPCLVSECGVETMEEWLQHPNLCLSERVLELARVIRAVADLHSLNLVHGDIKLSNIVYFPKERKWKFIDLDTASGAGEEITICYTLEYASPEVVIAIEAGKTKMVATKPMDLFSLGIICFEVITGKMIYGKGTDKQVIRDVVSSADAFATYSRVDIPQAQRLIDCLTAHNPDERITAAEALNKSLFGMSPPTNEKIDKEDFQKLCNDLEEVKRGVNILATDTHHRRLELELKLEAFMKSRYDPNAPFYQRATKPVLARGDDVLPDRPVFLTHIREEYLIQGCIRWSASLPQNIDHVNSVQLVSEDGKSVTLDVHEVCKDEEKLKFVALMDPVKLGSSKVTSVSPSCGTEDEKFVRLNLLVNVQIDGLVQQWVQLGETLYCQMHAPKDKFGYTKMVKAVEKAWFSLPQRARDVGRLSLYVAEKIVPGLVPL